MTLGVTIINQDRQVIIGNVLLNKDKNKALRDNFYNENLIVSGNPSENIYKSICDEIGM